MIACSFRALALPLLACSLAACSGSGKAPTGQVVATVDGKEITLTELRAELAGLNLSSAEDRKTAEQAALRQIIARRVMADAAREKKLDRTPEFVIQERKAEDTLLAEALQSELASAVLPPAREEIDRFIAAHPNSFAQRKILSVEQIRMARPADATKLERLKPLKTLDEIEQYLVSQGIEYRRGIGSVDAGAADPEIIEKILALPPGEVFAIPTGNVVLINQILDTKIVPFVGKPAAAYATKLLRARRNRETIGRQLDEILKSAETKVQYNEAYRPTLKSAATGPKS